MNTSDKRLLLLNLLAMTIALYLVGTAHTAAAINERVNQVASGRTATRQVPVTATVVAVKVIEFDQAAGKIRRVLSNARPGEQAKVMCIYVPNNKPCDVTADMLFQLANLQLKPGTGQVWP